MANSFLNLDDDDEKPESDIKIGTGLKSKPKKLAITGTNSFC